MDPHEHYLMRQKEHQAARKQAWALAFGGVAASLGKRPDDAIAWADRALAEFDIRFPAPKPSNGSEG